MPARGPLAKASGPQWRLMRGVLAATLPTPCPYCGCGVYPWQGWDIDHRIPQAMGGTDAWDNLRPAHSHCNRSIGGQLSQYKPRKYHGPSRDW